MSLAKLVVTEGPLTGCEFFVDSEETTIGRRTNNTIVVPDPAVSRLHGTIKPTRDGRWAYHDSGSENGTLVNGSRVKEQVLTSGDEIRIGNTVFRVLLSVETQQTAPPMPDFSDLLSRFGSVPEQLPPATSPGLLPMLEALDERAAAAESPFVITDDDETIEPAAAPLLTFRDLDPVRNPFSAVDRTQPITPDLGVAFRELSVIGRLLLQSSDLRGAAANIAESLVKLGRLTCCALEVRGEPGLRYEWESPSAQQAGELRRSQAVEHVTATCGVALATVGDRVKVQMAAAYSLLGAPVVIYVEREGTEPIAENQAYCLAAVADLVSAAAFTRVGVR